MRKSSGILLLLASAGSVAGYAALSNEPLQLSRLTSITAAGAQQVTSAATSLDPAPSSSDSVRPRVFSPATPLIAQGQAAHGQAAAPAVRLAQAPARAAEPIRPAPTFNAPSSGDGSRRLASSKPADDDARRELTRDLQKELKRVGCYDGELSGTWSPASKRAMGSFMDRVNATLPVEEPDYILLTLVQGHAAQACGKSCPSGQGLSGDGRCQPRAILAQSARKSDERKLVDRIEKRPAGDADMKLADAKGADNKQDAAKATETTKNSQVQSSAVQTGTISKTVPSSGSWTTATVIETSKPPAPQVAPQQVPMAQIILPPAATPAPLPGRMAMGAPVPAPEDDIDARKRRAQAALQQEQLIQAKTQAEAERLRAERLNADAERREKQVAAADARRLAQKQAESLEADRKAQISASAASAAAAAAKGTAGEAKGDERDTAAATVAAAAAAIAAQEAAERRAIARRAAAEQQRVRDAREARDRDREREQDRARERRVAAANAAAAPAVVRRVPPRYVPATVARAPAPTPRPAPEQRWTRTIFSDVSRGR
jgi:hypothetical protein